MDRCPEALVEWRVVATLLGTSTIFAPDVADSAWLLVHANPYVDTVIPPFERHQHMSTPALGIGSLHLYADVRLPLSIFNHLSLFS